jgi:hypothetical protein
MSLATCYACPKAGFGQNQTFETLLKAAAQMIGSKLINMKSAPAEWATLMYELEDAHEHLGSLIAQMNAEDDVDEVDLRIQLAHVFSHLNRAWHRRDRTDDFTNEEWAAASRFPADLDPI